jgi:hypothetical protein
MVDNWNLPTQPNSRVFSPGFGFNNHFLGSHSAHHTLSGRCRAVRPRFPGLHPVPIGFEGSGIATRSPTVQRRLVNPAAIAGVRSR